MKVINSDDYAASGIETFFFPGGEPHARLPEGEFGDALLVLRARTWNDLGLGMVVLDALQANVLASYKAGDRSGRAARVWVFVPYFPGARQDRSDGQTPKTKTILYSMLGVVADKVFTFDIHSGGNHQGRLSCPLHSFSVDELAPQADLPAPANAYIISPDSGATERAQRLATAARVSNPVLQCDKHRDFATGKFTHFTMPPLPGVGEYLIVDDICDGGGTFNLLAEEFLKDPYGADSSLALFVSHGIFSKGLGNIHPKIEQIFTTDSFTRPNESTDRLDVISLQPLIDKIVESAE